MIEALTEFMPSLSSGGLRQESESTPMKAFAFDGTADIATSKDVDRTPIGTDWFSGRMHKSAVFSPLEDWMFNFYPSTVSIDSKRFKLTPWVGYAAHWGVSRAVKEVIDNLEPGKHQFIPVKLSYGTGGTFEVHDYFTLQVNTMENAVDLEKSDVNWEELYGGGRTWMPKSSVPVVLPKTTIEHLHLWRNKKIQKWMMSGDLKDALAKRDLTACLKFEEHFVV